MTPTKPRMTPAVRRALERVAKGETPYAAAKVEQIAISTIYRAQKRLREAATESPSRPE